MAFSLWFLGPSLSAQEPFPDFGTRFTQYAGNPLLTLESSNPWSFPHPGYPYTALPGTIHPDVLYFPEGQDGYKFWMIFTPYEGWLWGPRCGGYHGSECPPKPWSDPLQYWERLTLVRSHDGVNWEATGIDVNPVVSPPTGCLGGEWDAGTHYDPDLVYVPAKGSVPARWLLYFAVRNGCGGAHTVGLATSADGIHYTKHGPVMPELATPTVVYDPDANGGEGLFYAWYLYGTAPGASLGFATSPDGIHWTPAWTPSCPSSEPCWENGVLQPELAFCETGLSHPDVIKKGDEFWIYYQAEAPPQPPPTPPPAHLYHNLTIRRARSTDGIHWTKDVRPVLEKYDSTELACTTTNPMPDQWTFWDRTGPAASPTPVTMFYRPSAVVVGDALYLYFGALNKTTYSHNPSDRDIGVAFSSRFDDVPPIHWAYAPVEAVAKAGISSGCGGHNFCPDAVVPRKAAAVFVAQAAEIPHPPGAYDRNFCDIADDGYASHINALFEAGMVDACGACGGTDPRVRFCPDASMTRLDLGLFFHKALGLVGDGVPYFTDVLQPYKPLIDRLHDPDVAIVNGCAANLYCPDAPATRAMLAAMTTAAYLVP